MDVGREVSHKANWAVDLWSCLSILRFPCCSASALGIALNWSRRMLEEEICLFLWMEPDCLLLPASLAKTWRMSPEATLVRAGSPVSGQFELVE